MTTDTSKHQCEALVVYTVPYAIRVADGVAFLDGGDGLPGSIRSRQCKRTAQGEIQGVHLCNGHAGIVAFKRPLYLIEGRMFEVIP